MTRHGKLCLQIIEIVQKRQRVYRDNNVTGGIFHYIPSISHELDQIEQEAIHLKSQRDIYALRHLHRAQFIQLMMEYRHFNGLTPELEWELHKAQTMFWAPPKLPSGLPELNKIPLHLNNNLPNATGIYFLMHQMECVYIGLTEHLRNRIYAHNVEKTFDSIRFLPHNGDGLRELESIYVFHYRPRYNDPRGTKLPPRQLESIS